MHPEAVLAMLNDMYEAFDKICKQHDVFKVDIIVS